MTRFLRQLTDQLDADRRDARGRSLRALPAVGKHVTVEGRRLLNLASNDYLGLADDPRLKAAAIDAVQRLGTGGSASRLVTGHLEIHEQAERAFASFKHAGRALLLPTGYLANLAVLTTLPRKGDLILIDKLTHASLIDAARASAADFRTFPHLDYSRAERLLQRHRESAEADTNAFLVTDSVFSMDGDSADLPALCDLADRYDAVTVVDEAHGTGVLGETGAGLAEAQDVADRIDITISTASKALGGLGGIVTAAAPVIDTLISKARPFIYTSAVPPSQAATLLAALDVVREEPQRRQRLAAIIAQVREALNLPGGFIPGGTLPGGTPILPLVTGSAASALALAEQLRDAGILAVAIRPPTVAPGTARVRLSLRADLSDEDVAGLIRVVGREGRRVRS